MPRPTDIKGLLELSEINLNKLLDFINELPDEIKNQIPRPLGRGIKPLRHE